MDKTAVGRMGIADQVIAAVGGIVNLYAVHGSNDRLYELLHVIMAYHILGNIIPVGVLGTVPEDALDALVEGSAETVSIGACQIDDRAIETIETIGSSIRIAAHGIVQVGREIFIGFVEFGAGAESDAHAFGSFTRFGSDDDHAIAGA